MFPVLEAGASKFPYNKAIKIAEKAVKQYSEHNPDSSIKEVILIKYNQFKKYCDTLNTFDNLIKLDRYNVDDDYIDTDSVMGARTVRVGEKLRREIRSETDRIYLKYLDEQNKYCEKMKDKESSQNICKRFNDELYCKLFQMPIDSKTQKAIKRSQLAEDIYVPDDNVISKYKNPDYYFLKKKINVIRLGLGLRLSLENFCRFVWCKGYRFPIDKLDFELVKYIKDDRHKEALEKYSSMFISKRSSDICYENESKEENEMDLH